MNVKSSWQPALCVAVVGLLALPLLPGCTWVKLDEAAQRVRVAYDGVVNGCQRQGEIGVSVKDRVGFYERNALKVRDELESLARNEAIGLQADTLVPLGDPANGEQRFSAWRCADAKAVPSTPNERDDPVQTFPVK